MWYRSSTAWCVYDWSCWIGTLGENVSPRARRVRARIGESPQRVARRLPRYVKYLLIHLDISENTPFIENAAEFTRVMSARGVAVFNSAPADIRKTTLQSCCESYGLRSLSAGRDGEADELLIVKTDLNSGGSREQLLSAKVRKRFDLPASLSRLKGPSGYFVSRRGDLTADVWSDSNLVVEKYISNPHGRFYRVYVAGTAVVVSEAYNGDKVKRMGGDMRRLNHLFWRRDASLESHAAAPHELAAGLLHTAGTFMHRFQVDYGALDIVEGAGLSFYVVDVNKTPYWGKEHQPGLLEHLRLGFAQIGGAGIAA